MTNRPLLFMKDGNNSSASINPTDSVHIDCLKISTCLPYPCTLSETGCVAPAAIPRTLSWYSLLPRPSLTLSSRHQTCPHLCRRSSVLRLIQHKGLPWLKLVAPINAIMILRYSSHSKLTSPFLSLTFILIQILALLNSSAATSDHGTKDAPLIIQHKLETPRRKLPSWFDDSEVILFLDKNYNVLRSDNAGAEFTPISDVPGGSAYGIYLHKFEKSTAYIWGRKGTHYVTHDRGKSWKEFVVPGYPVSQDSPFEFHAGDPNKVLVNVCTSIFLCDEIAFYTLDGFESPVKELRTDTRGCLYARNTPEWGMNFVGGDEDRGTDNDDRIVCVVLGKFVEFPFSSRDNRLVVSDNYFKSEEEPILEAGRTVHGIINIAVVKGFLVAAASAKKTDELALYVSGDAKQWHRAVFPQDHRLEEDAYTILESTNYSIQVDVMTTLSPLNPMGVMFTSNSNGTYFTRNIEHTNRDTRGLVDFEKVTGIQGIVLVNKVDNWKEVEESPFRNKKLKSMISFDDGRNFKKITADKEEIHLHSVTQRTNMGKVYSSMAPGLVMGVGNKGEYLKKYGEGDLYVSDDAGVTWSKALEGPHKHEFGDRGAVIIAVSDKGPTDEIRYSLDHGKNWKKANLEEKVIPTILITTPDSTSLKFFMMATTPDDREADTITFSIDFTGYHKGGKCGEHDFEKWYARVDAKGEPTCIMGHKQWYRRRKPDSECFVDKEFEDPVPQYEVCPCSKEDFECDYNYVKSGDGKECIPSGTLEIPAEQCKSNNDHFKGSSGFRLIPGNACDSAAKGAENLEKEIERPCKEGSVKSPASGRITPTIKHFDSSSVAEYHYLERTDMSSGDDETVVMRTNEGHLYITDDAGKSWKRIFKDERITAIVPHTYMNDIVYFLTEGKKVHYSYNRGMSFGHFKAPDERTKDRNLPVLGFHPNYKDYLIWTGAANCDHGKGQCHNDASFSENRGATWEHKLRYVEKCEFIDEAGRGTEKTLLYCEQHKDERLDQPLQLKWSKNWFADENQVFGDILDFATMSEFIVVAVKKEDDPGALTCHTSVNGKDFAHAQFPPSFQVPTEKAYTVLESKSHSVFLHVTVSSERDFEYGSIMKSDSNGTYYVVSLNDVNRNGAGFVDYEKADILEGVMLANVVKNIDEAGKSKSKALATVITHNDGAQWTPIKAPAQDAEGDSYGCDVLNIEQCSLHLHSYTERPDKRATFSSKSAVGLMLGVGNVGSSLGPKEEGDTFMTRDGGIEWYPVKKGNYLWKYGDQGSVIVIVPEGIPTKSVFYTLNEGRNWIEYSFTDSELPIHSISSAPSDKSRNFILWSNGNADKKITTINLDFTGLTDQRCEIDEKDPENGDYYLWKPHHPLQDDNCLFGHVAQYHRKNPEAECYNGPNNEILHSIARNCSCVRADFEWYVFSLLIPILHVPTSSLLRRLTFYSDYNYQIASDGSCQLVPGLTPPDHSQQCVENPDLNSYYLPTGYRRTPLDTCSGGKELEYTSTQKPCPHHEKEFEEEQHSKGLGGFWFFVLVFVLPISIATGAGYWVYQNWDGKFGRIRLGEGGPSGSGDVFDADKPWIKYPIVAISGLVAVAASLPLVAGSAWRGLMGVFGRGGGYGRVGTYSSRSDFSRDGRYAVVDPEEDELFGDEEEEEGNV